jgi:AP-3 complex subunit beta
VRALALRVLSSIRVHVIVPVVILAVRKCALDPSPHVRKAAAHAVPKMYRTDRGREDELVEVIEALLRDGAPMVLSSAVAAFVEVCPHRLDLLHRHYRKLCCLLVDTDEWGQVLLANLLLRYARTQFTPPDDMRREALPGDADADAAAAMNGTGGPGASAMAHFFALPTSAPGTPHGGGPGGGTPGGGAYNTHFGGGGAQPARRPPSPRARERDLQALLRAGSSFYDEDDEEGDEGGEEGGRSGKGAPPSKHHRSKKDKGSAKATPTPPPPPPPPVVAPPPEAGAAPEGSGEGATPTAGAAETPTGASRGVGALDEDHRLLLRCSRPLLQSRNAAVVLAVATLQWYLSPAGELPRVAKALVFAVRSSPEAAHVLLQNCVAMACLAPALFAPYLPAFFVVPRDSAAVRALKLELLTRCATPAAADRLLTELQVCLRDANRAAVVLAVRAVGRCAARLPHIAPACVRSLMELSSHPTEEVAAEAVVVLRALIQQRPAQHGAVVVRLIRRLEQLRAPAARAAVVWLAAWEHGTDEAAAAAEAKPVQAAADAAATLADGAAAAAPPAPPAVSAADAAAAAAAAAASAKLAKMAPHALRLVARTFAEEDECTKLALLGSAAKLALRTPSEVGLLYAHVLELAAVDASYDVRDRARLLRALVPPPGPDGTPAPVAATEGQHAALASYAHAILFCAKPAPPLPSPAPLRGQHMLNTLSHTVQHTAPGYVALPPHPEVPPPASVRAAPARAPMAQQQQPGVGGPRGGPGGGPMARGGRGGPAPRRGNGGGGGDFYSSSGSSSGSSSSGSSASLHHLRCFSRNAKAHRQNGGASLFPWSDAYGSAPRPRAGSYSDSESESESDSYTGSEEEEEASASEEEDVEERPGGPPAPAAAAAAPPAGPNDPTSWDLPAERLAEGVAAASLSEPAEEAQ